MTDLCRHDEPEHIVELSNGDRVRLIEWLRSGTGAWIPQSSSRLTIEACGHGGIFIRTRPWS
jgi:hypothetical protein